jgi:hypothetical protein
VILSAFLSLINSRNRKAVSEAFIKLPHKLYSEEHNPLIQGRILMTEATEIHADVKTDREIKSVPPQLLRPHPINAKIYGNEGLDKRLVESIEEGGIIEEIQVTAELQVVSGHRRLAAAIHLQLETVPICVRYDLDTEDKIVWALIEANRTQRVKSLEQKVREIMEVNERIKAFRAEVANRYGTSKLSEIAEMDVDPQLVRTPGAKEVQEYIKEHNPKDNSANSAIAIVLNHYGMSETHYKKARKAMNAIDAFVSKGKIVEADEIRHALNTKGMKAFDKVVDRLRGVTVARNFKSPSTLVKKAVDAFTEAIEHLPKDGAFHRRACLALGTLKATRAELARMATNRELSPATERIQNDPDPNSEAD